MQNYFYVYMYIDPETRKPFYIGKGQRSRAWSFTGHSHNKWCIQKINTLKKKGYKSKDFVVILEQDLDETVALEKETKLIELYGKKKDGGILFNVNDGGIQPPSQLGKKYKLSEESKQKIKESWSIQRRQQMSEYSKNYIRTPEWCEKISNSKRKISFNKEQFEELVRSNYLLKDIMRLMSLSLDIIRDRFLITYGTSKFKDIKKIVLQ